MQRQAPPPTLSRGFPRMDGLEPDELLEEDSLRVYPIWSIDICTTLTQALRGEAEHAASGAPDFESGTLESRPPSPSIQPPPQPPNVTRGLGKKDADKARRKLNRQLAKQRQPGRPRSSLSKKYAKPISIKVDYDALSLPAAKGAFVSRLPKERSGREWSLGELIDGGFKEIEWDGCTPTVLVDKEGRIITVLAGRPSGNDWDKVHEQISTLLREAGPKASNPRKKERRGDYTSLSFGVSYGGGQQAPGNLAHGERNRSIIREAAQTKAVQRVAGFMNACFASYAPKVYEEYRTKLSLLFARDTRLERIFSNSIFPTATFNCGPRVVTLDHVDNTNVPFGFCAIFACGSYNPAHSGHLILFDLGLVVRFPPGSTVLIPSGTLRHGNVSVKSNETRQSFTQYCPGGLLRWVAHGFKPATESTLKGWFEEHHEERCQKAAGLFSKIDELEQDRRTVFSLSAHM